MTFTISVQDVIAFVAIAAAGAYVTGWVGLYFYRKKKSIDQESATQPGITKAECTACDLRSFYGTITEQMRLMFVQSREEVREDLRELKADLKGEIKEVREDLRAHTNREREVA